MKIYKLLLAVSILASLSAFTSAWAVFKVISVDRGVRGVLEEQIKFNDSVIQNQTKTVKSIDLIIKQMTNQ